MSLRERMAFLLRGRVLVAASCLLPFAAMLAFHLETQHDWHSANESLERENLSLQLRTLAQSLRHESDDLKAALRSLAESESVLELVQDSPAPSARLDAKSIAP